MQRGERGVSDHPMRGSERHRRAGRRGRPAHRGGSDPYRGQGDLRALRPVPSAARRVRPTRRPHPPLRARGAPRHDHAGRAPAARVRSRRAGASQAVKTPPAELIRRKRDGAALGDEELAHLVAGIVDGSVSDGQVAAFAMAVYFRGMTQDECVALTAAMTRSGSTLDWSRSGLDGPVLDKHSTGGVGDKVSLILAPVVAACGGFVPMISGRGLGHTGGTLDKLSSIPGYDTTPDVGRFRVAVRAAGCAIVGQTAALVPADRRLYAIRDVTATVDSIPLITASILSKKLAARPDALVMDVKVGSGAFATSLETATVLAESLLAVAEDAGLRAVALLTDMAQVLGHHVGNALEVREAVDFLAGRRQDVRLHAVTAALASDLLVLGGLARDSVDASAAVE